MGHMDPNQEQNSSMVHGPSMLGSMNPPISPMSRAPSHNSSFDFDFSMPSSASNPNPFARHSQEGGQWNGQGGGSGANGHGAMNMFANGGQDANNIFGSTGAYDPSSTLDSSFFYDGTSQFGVLPGSMASIAPSTHFPAPGLPFRGLDYIRNFDNGNGNDGYQDTLAHTFDAGAFRLDPEIGFNLADFTNFDQANGQ